MSFIRNPLIYKILALGVPLLIGGAFLGSVPAGAVDDGDAWLGILLQDLSSPLREAMDLDEDQGGVLITDVVRKSPAEDAGIETGDLLISIDGNSVNSAEEVIDRVQAMEPGAHLNLSLLRDGRSRNIRVTLGTRDDSEISSDLVTPRAPRAPRTPRASRGVEEPLWIERHRGEGMGLGHLDRLMELDGEGADRGYLGVSTLTLGEQLAAYFQVDTDRGVLVTEVTEDSPAAKAGVLAGDVILSINKSDVNGPGDLRRLVRAHDPEDQIEIEIKRKGATMLLNATLGSSEDLGDLAPEVYWLGRRGLEGHPQHFEHLERRLERLHERTGDPGRGPHRFRFFDVRPGGAEI